MTLYIKKIVRYYLNDSKNLDDIYIYIQYFHTLYYTATTANLSCDCNGFRTNSKEDY